MSRARFFWNALYPLWPAVVKTLVFLRFHDFRQEYLLGRIAPGHTAGEMEEFLRRRGFEDAILAWYDPGEVFSLRVRDGELFQHHVRLFDDGEIRGHYEYAPEAHPWKHIFQYRFEANEDFWSETLGEFLTRETKIVPMKAGKRPRITLARQKPPKR